MERIKEALERAKKQRDGSGDTVVTGVRRRPAARQARGPLTIEYTETRVFEPDPGLLRANRVIAGRTGDAVADAYRMLRTRIMRVMDEHGWNSIAVTSAGAGEGKTLTAVNLAISMAREVDKTVLLVDLDLRRPGVHRIFGLEPAQGVADFLRGDAGLSDVLVNPGIERFVMLPGRGRVEDSSELLTSPRMKALSEEIKSRYRDRIVVFDLPPVLVVDDALAFAPQVDAFVLVVEEGKTQSDDIAAASKVLSNAKILGTILNKAEEAMRDYYY